MPALNIFCITVEVGYSCKEGNANPINPLELLSLVVAVTLMKPWLIDTVELDVFINEKESLQPLPVKLVLSA